MLLFSYYYTLPSFSFPISSFISLRHWLNMTKTSARKSNVPRYFIQLIFFSLSCTLCSLSLFFRSAAVGFGWSWMVSTKPIDLCRVCSVNPVNLTWHNYKRAAQELTGDCVLLRCLTTTHVYQSTSGYSLKTP